MIDIGELRNLGTVHLGQPDRPRQPNLKTAKTSFSESPAPVLLYLNRGEAPNHQQAMPEAADHENCLPIEIGIIARLT
jgi:hypothetical protein